MTTIDPAYLADQLRQYRRVMNLTQENVAAACGLALRTIEKLESGRHAPAEQTVRSLCRGLSIKRSYFIKPTPEEAAQHKAAMLKALRTTAVVRTHIVRTAKDMLSGLDSFHAWNCDMDKVGADGLELAAAFLQTVMEWGEVWSEIPMTGRLEAASGLAEVIRELEVLGYLVHMGRYRAVRRYPSGPPLNFAIGLVSVRPRADAESQDVAIIELQPGWELPSDEVPAVPLDMF